MKKNSELQKEIETPVLLAHAIEDSTDIFGISGGGGLNPPNSPLGTPLTQTNSSSPNPEPNTADNVEWSPGSRYLRSQLYTNNTISDPPYQLRSRAQHRVDVNADKNKHARPDLIPTASADTLPAANAGSAATPLGLSYNLRSRTLSH